MVLYGSLSDYMSLAALEFRDSFPEAMLALLDSWEQLAPASANVEVSPDAE